MAASYIPTGYRLLTADDAGKVFGTDLELNFYIDNTVTPNFSNPSITIELGGYIGSQDEIGIYSASLSFISWDQEDYYIYTSGSWEGYDFTQPFSVSPHDDDSYHPMNFHNYSTGTYVNNWLYVKDIFTPPKEEFISSMNSLGKSITNKAGASGKKSITELKDLVDNLKTTFTGQEKTVTPSKTSQVITPDSGYDGLSKVTVDVIPSSYIIPSGTLAISENGTKDVTQYASVEVNIQPTYWDGTYEESDE